MNSEGGKTKIEVRLENETVWLTQKLLAELFQVGVNTVNYHIKEIYSEGELMPEATIRKFRIVKMADKFTIWKVCGRLGMHGGRNKQNG